MIKFKFFGNDEFYECTNIADLISAVRKNSFFTKKYKIVGFYIQKNIFKYESVLCVLYEKSKEIYENNILGPVSSYDEDFIVFDPKGSTKDIYKNFITLMRIRRLNEE